ncbi:hypothetical protein [Kitasatospora cheerisanensis]|uniref:Uncharacterized protein n=1 Tax=Kitasatospora cheerisanensis KCTC 2395 TaxID=1348663 RepID=A0A066YT20_9ACTN|nr:hypothetical protein [Kitasatospora cheerisanensis]KDN84397.1 hypothetical protein KCH_41880 [Kitasatospora cheerisanensis KCTC 2395]
MSDRAQLINGIRQFADWLEANPDVAAPSNPRFLLPLSTNSAVAVFAAEHSLTTTSDAEGNLSAVLTFGPLSYEAYGYVDFEEHRAALEEKNARDWAAKNGLRITTGTCARCKRPFDASDTRWDGHDRYKQTDYCRNCVDRCHDSEIADHRCVICA